MSSLETTTKPLSEKFFRENFTRNFLIILIISFLIPLALIGALNYLRTRDLLLNQASDQLQTIVLNQAKHLELISIPGQKALNDLAVQGNLVSEITALSQNPNNRPQRQTFNSRYLYPYQSISNTSEFSVFDQIWGITPDGTILIATNESWIGKNLSAMYMIQQLNNTNHDLIAYNPEPLYSDEAILFSARVIKDSSGNILVTFIGSSRQPDLLNTLATTNSFFKSSDAFIFTENNDLVTVSKTGQQLFAMNPNQQHLDNLASISAAQSGPQEITAIDGQKMLGFSKKIPDLGIGLALEVPQTEIYKDLDTLNRNNIYLSLISILVISVLFLLITQQVTNPIRKLTEQAKQLTEGNWDAKILVKRRDEIGLLAYTFNDMASRLSSMHQNLEQKVEERTQQLRTASDIVDLAASATNEQEITRRTVDLLAERFDLIYTAVFTLNEAGTLAILRNEGGELSKEQPSGQQQIYLDPETLIGAAALNKKAHSRTIDSTAEKTWPIVSEKALSETAIPIVMGSQVIGVLYAQSSKSDTFTPETQSVLQTLANQIAAGMQKILLLQNSEVNLAETTALYRTGMRLNQSTNKANLLKFLSEGLAETSLMTGLYAIEGDQIHLVKINNPENRSANPNTALRLSALQISKEMANQSLIILDNLTESPAFSGILNYFARQGCKRAALLSIQESGHPSIIIAVCTRDRELLTGAKLQSYSTLAQIAATTLEKLHANDALGQRLNELQTMSNLSSSISNETDLIKLYSLVHKSISDSMGSDLIFAIARYNAKNQTVEIPYLYENSSVSSMEPFPLGEGLTSYLISNKKPLLLNRNAAQQAQEMGAKIIGSPVKSWLGVPLMVGGEIIGAVILEDNENEDRFTQNDLELMNTLSFQIAAAVKNAQLFRDLQDALEDFTQERYLLNTLMENIPDQVYFKDQEGHYLRVSNSYANSLNENPESLIGKTDLDISDDPARHETMEIERNILAEGKGILNEIEHDVNDKWYQISRIPIYNAENEPFGVFGISNDISDLKKAENIAQLRANQLQTAAEIARDTTRMQDANEFFKNIVNLVRDRYGFYHASIFLLDPMGNYAILKESTGEAGEQLKKAKHRLAVGSQSLVGQATQKNAYVVVNDVTLDPNYYPNPFLPQTRSELVIPMRVENKVLGALDVQSTLVDAFSREDIEILQILTDQLSAAILSSNLFARSQANLDLQRKLQDITAILTTKQTEEEVYRAIVEGLGNIKTNSRIALFMTSDNNKLQLRSSSGFTNIDISRLDSAPDKNYVHLAQDQKKSILIENTLSNSEVELFDNRMRSGLAIPLNYKDRILGVLAFESVEIADFANDEKEFFENWVNNIGSILANTRLLAQIQHQVERQQAINEITNNIRQTVDLQTILQTSAAEICKALGANSTRIKINPEIEELELFPQESNKIPYNGIEKGEN